MQQSKFLLMWSFLSLMLAGCTQQQSSTTNSGSTANPLPITTTGGSSSGTTGGTTGTSSGGQTYTTIPSDNNWQSLYPNGVPAGSCSTPSGSGYDLRRGTITASGGTWYTPANAFASVGELEYTSIHYTHNNSSFLVNVNDAKSFFDTDAKLRVRLKVRPQPKPPVGKSWCFNRVTGQSADTAGYTVLRFNVSLRGVNADGSLKPALQGTQSVTVPVNSCSTAIDFSGLNQQHPDGVVLVVHDVQSDQGCWYSQGCNSFVAVRQASCWQMDFEVSVDGTKDI